MGRCSLLRGWSRRCSTSSRTRPSALTRASWSQHAAAGTSWSGFCSGSSPPSKLKFGKSDFEKRHYALLALMCIYGIELLADNIAECRANMLEIFAEYLNIDESDDLYRAASYVLSQNLVHGDALTMRTHDGQPITFAEWGYLGKGKFQRRDFRFDVLTGSSAFSAEGSLFAHLGKHEIFTPTKTYPPMTVSELAAAAHGGTPKEAA